MDRLPHHAPGRRRPRLAVAVGTAVLIAALGSGAYAAIPQRGVEQQRISFTGSGPAPLICATHPDVTNLTIAQGTRIVLANFTGSDVTVDTGRRRAVTIEDGKAVSVRLRRGQHELRMIPRCLIVRAAAAVSVTVLRASEIAPTSPAPPPDPTLTPGGPGVNGGEASATAAPSPTPATPSPPSRSPAPVAPSDASPSTSAGPSLARAPTSEAVSTSPPPADGGPGGAAEGDMMQYAIDADIYDVLPFPVDRPPDEKDGRTLAVIATICVLGVTGAIIRAILAQRTSGMVRT